MSELTYAKIDQTVLDTLRPASRAYWFTVVLLAAGIIGGLACWIYQIFIGIGVGGQNNPVAWGTYLINFVFWV
ncbi:MAG: hydrogenase, partial [Thermodesulfobacteriota bacterium]|nr:hydrogenase [Thermodesulfobacteriota bacterium]